MDSVESEESQNRQRSEQLSTQAMKLRYPELYKNTGDAASSQDPEAVRATKDKGKQPLETNDEDDVRGLTTEEIQELARRYEAQASLVKARTALREASMQPRSVPIWQDENATPPPQVPSQRSRQASVVSQAPTVVSQAVYSNADAAEQAEDFLARLSPAGSATWARGWKAPAIFDQDRIGGEDDDSEEETPRRRAVKSLSIRSYNLHTYSGKDQRDLDVWAKTMEDVWKWSGDQFGGGQEQFVSFTTQYLPANLREAWGRHSRDHPIAAKRFPALMSFLQSYLGDESQRTAYSWNQWMKAKQRKGQTSLEFLQYLRSLEDFIPQQAEETLALHYFAALDPTLAHNIKISGRPKNTRAQMQAAAAAIEDPGMGNVGGRKPKRGGSPTHEEEKMRGEGGGRRSRGPWKGRGGRTGYYGRRRQEEAADSAAPDKGANSKDKPFSSANTTPMGTSQRGPGQCFVCHETGHMANVCPNRDKANKARGTYAVAAKHEEESKNEPASP